MFVFGELLRGFRSREGLSQQQLADSIGVGRSTIINWEKSNYLPRNLNQVHRIAEVLNLSPEDTDRLLAAANPYKRQDPGVVGVIRTRSGLIEILQEDISFTIQVISELPDTFPSEGLGKAQIKKLAKMFNLLESRKINQHLRHNDGDVSYWLEQGYSLNELVMEFAARKVVLDAADRGGTNIDDQGTLSLAATRVIPSLLR